MEAVAKERSRSTKVKKILSDFSGSKDMLISILQDIQSEFGYLPEDSLRQVAKSLNLPAVQVYGVATFFKAFSLVPRGEHMVHVCLGTACHVRGAESVLEELERRLDVERGKTTRDMKFTLETVNCLGACALGPIVVMDGKYHGQMSPGKVKSVHGRYAKASKDKKRCKN